MKKGVAIPYVIAILLGIAVIGLIGFWLFKSSGIFGTKTVEQDCRNKFLRWCQDWFADGYDKAWMTGTATSTKPFFNSKHSECKPYKLPGTDCAIAGSTCAAPFDTADNAVPEVKKTCFIPA